jgi:hypothetical protein
MKGVVFKILTALLIFEYINIRKVRKEVWGVASLKLSLVNQTLLDDFSQILQRELIVFGQGIKEGGILQEIDRHFQIEFHHLPEIQSCDILNTFMNISIVKESVAVLVDLSDGPMGTMIASASRLGAQGSSSGLLLFFLFFPPDKFLRFLQYLINVLLLFGQLIQSGICFFFRGVVIKVHRFIILIKLFFIQVLIFLAWVQVKNHFLTLLFFDLRLKSNGICSY